MEKDGVNKAGERCEGAVYAQLSDPNNQTLGQRGVGVPLKFSKVDESNNITVKNQAEIVIPEAGVYSVVFTVQAGVDDGYVSQWTADFWMKLNGVNVPNSNKRISQNSSRNTDVVVIQAAMFLSTRDRLQLWGSGWTEGGGCDRGNVKALAFVVPGEPNIPSVTATIYRIGD